MDPVNEDQERLLLKLKRAAAHMKAKAIMKDNDRFLDVETEEPVRNNHPHPFIPQPFTTDTGKAMRSNNNKVPMSHTLDFPRAMSLLSQVAAMGAKKYERGNFQKGQDASITIDCMMRHLYKWWAGEDTDPESGLSHLGHVMWNAVVLAEDMERGIQEQDDRTFNSPDIKPIHKDTFQT